MRLGVVQPIAVEDDAALVAAFRGGDLGAAGRLYDRHVTRCTGSCFACSAPRVKWTIWSKGFHRRPLVDFETSSASPRHSKGGS